METHERRSQQAILDDVLCNRTGIMTHPELSAELIEGAKNTSPSSQGDGAQMAASRADYFADRLAPSDEQRHAKRAGGKRGSGDGFRGSGGAAR